jgi:hypothetical protein
MKKKYVTLKPLSQDTSIAVKMLSCNLARVRNANSGEIKLSNFSQALCG